MATARKRIQVCDRDAFGREKEATQTRQFSVENSYYKLRLCEQHAQAFDRELFGWSRVAEEQESPFATKNQTFDSRYIERARRAAELRSAEAAAASAAADREQQNYGELEEVVEVAASNVFQLGRDEEIVAGKVHRSGWMFTNHAVERAEQRGYALTEALEAAVNPEITYADRAHLSGRRVHQHGECAVVVNTERKVVITVLHRDEARYALDHHNALSERIAT